MTGALRFILGDQKLFDELVQRFDKQVVQGNGREFVTAKLNEREDRHKRVGQSRYLVEPNVKDGKGGLRDLNTLFWIAQYLNPGQSIEKVLHTLAEAFLLVALVVGIAIAVAGYGAWAIIAAS